MPTQKNLGNFPIPGRTFLFERSVQTDFFSLLKSLHTKSSSINSINIEKILTDGWILSETVKTGESLDANSWKSAKVSRPIFFHCVAGRHAEHILIFIN
jgi:hypothetical protein